MNVRIKPGLLKGDLIVPPSKSLSHRAIIAAGLSKGKSVISNILFSKDILATISAIEAIGAKVTRDGDTLTILGKGYTERKNNVIDSNESGSTVRFMIPIALTVDEPITFIGKNNLVNRPLDAFLEIFNEQGIKYEKEANTYLPLKVFNGLKSGEFKIKGDISSQFITGLLYALPLLNGDSKIIITTELESKGYIDLTIDMLKLFGIEIINNNYKEFIIKGNQTYKPHDYQVEGDYSQSAFFLVADLLGSDINLLAMNPNSHQGDKKIIEDIKAFNGKIDFKNNILKAYPTKTNGATIDFSQSPDLGPAIAVLASLSKGKTEFVNAARLRIKECDRITCVREELEKLGVKIEENPDGMIIEGMDKVKGGILDSHNDHRLRMSFAVLATVASGDVVITNAECVSKSFPNFFEVFEALGGNISYE